RFKAIEAAAFPLIQDKMVKDGFLEAVLKREEAYPTGLPTPIGVAIPHTEPEYIKEEGISVVVLREPVIFRGMGAPEEAVETSILFMLAIKDGDKQIVMLQKIVSLIQDEMVLHKIKGAKSTETIYNLIREENDRNNAS
ncbi:MAG: PTS sugar transporter subunit IIA, partial [Eubacterium sp.]